MSNTAVADAIASSLAEAEVPYVFGMPGGGNNLDVIGACEVHGIEFILAHTETGAAIMATAFAELADTVGACLVTRGPGAASAVNGAAQAHLDRQPLLMLCDTVDEASSSRIAHQSIDQPAMFAPVTKWSTTIGAAQAPSTMRDAVRTATTSPRGAVHLDIDPGSSSPQPAPAPPEEHGEVGDVRTLIAQAQRPVILVGVGARPHSAAVRAMVEGTGIPVLMTYKAKGVVPDAGSNAAGTFTGARTDGAVIDQADLIIAVGVDSVELIPNPWPYSVPLVALTEAPDAYPYFDADTTIVGPLAKLLPELPTLNDNWPAGFARRRQNAVDRALMAGPDAGQGLTPWLVAQSVRDAARDDSVATVDAGAHMLVIMPLWKTQEPGQVLISSGLATMGYSVPAAIGAALARPAVRVYCFVGDGGLTMCLGELETVARLGLSITVVVFNDATLSLIKAKQRPSGHGGPSAVDYTRTDFATVARGMGLASTSIDTAEQLQQALANAPAGAELLDVRVQPDGYPYVIDVVRNRLHQ